jgi:sugar O-acyltransferase (sialic acid O-acetyltransferase NeuD family)
MKTILLWGGRSMTRVIQKMIEDQERGDAKILTICDPALPELPFESDVVFINRAEQIRDMINGVSHFVVCVGGEHGYARYLISRKLQDLGLNALELVSKHALLDDPESVGNGLQMMPGSIVHKFSRIGHQCIINTNATVDHECILGNGVHIMGGASIAGKVDIGDYATIGTNATVLPNLKIGKAAYVGAGAVVTRDVDDNQIVVGVPARFLRMHEPHADLSVFDDI